VVLICIDACDRSPNSPSTYGDHNPRLKGDRSPEKPNTNRPSPNPKLQLPLIRQPQNRDRPHEKSPDRSFQFHLNGETVTFCSNELLILTVKCTLILIKALVLKDYGLLDLSRVCKSED
jgi:hypothetical protein